MNLHQLIIIANLYNSIKSTLILISKSFSFSNCNRGYVAVMKRCREVDKWAVFFCLEMFQLQFEKVDSFIK